MTVFNIEAKIKGSSKASVTPIRMMSISASLAGKASAGNKGRPKENPKKTKQD